MILVVGSTGLVGGMITRRLLDGGEDVRILVRPGSPHQPLVDAGARPVFGDLKEPATLEAACRGADVVITTASAGQRGGADTPESVDLEGNRHLVDAAAAAGVRQLIYISALTATEDSPIPLLRAKARTESYLRDGGVPYTILAPDGIMDVMFPLVVADRLAAGRPVTIAGEGLRRHSYVAARDIAAFAVAAVRNTAALNRRIPIGGPEAVSWCDVVAAYERVLQRPIPVQSVPPGAILPDLPPVPGLAELVSGLMAALETFDSPVEMEGTARAFGVRMTSVEDFVRDQRASMPPAQAPAH